MTRINLRHGNRRWPKITYGNVIVRAIGEWVYEVCTYKQKCTKLNMAVFTMILRTIRYRMQGNARCDRAYSPTQNSF